MPEILERNLRSNYTDSLQSNESIGKVLCDTFRETDESWKRYATEKLDDIKDPTDRFKERQSGSTACALLVAPTLGRYWCANAGDGRAIMITQSQDGTSTLHAKALSTDHKPTCG